MGYLKPGDDTYAIGEVDIELAILKEVIRIPSNQSPEDIWFIGSDFIAGRKGPDSTSLVIWDLSKKTLRLEKEFSLSAEIANKGGLDPFLWSVAKLNEQVIALITMDIFAEGTVIVIYDWIEDCILATCKADVSEIVVGVVNDDLVILSEEDFCLKFGTYYVRIPLKGVLSNRKQDTVQQIDFGPFGKFFMRFDSNCLEDLGNQKNRALLMKGFLTHNIFIMRKRNRRLEMLRFLKRELQNTYHPYVIQDIVKTVFE